jgi:hypothetical protein
MKNITIATSVGIRPAGDWDETTIEFKDLGLMTPFIINGTANLYFKVGKNTAIRIRAFSDLAATATVEVSLPDEAMVTYVSCDLRVFPTPTQTRVAKEVIIKTDEPTDKKSGRSGKKSKSNSLAVPSV